jgi:hypothetical protein
MSNHTLTKSEIMSIPAGRIMNTMIQEYIVRESPTRWSNGQQKELPCRWFDEHPRSCAEDDGGYCCADSLPDYSGDVSRAFSLALLPTLKDKKLSTQTDNTEHWASFGNVPYERKDEVRCWVQGPSVALAICRAALLAV